MTASILLVDDRTENLVAMEAALEPLGFRLVSALSGEDALRKLLVEEFALVVLDVQMPGIDGFETARAIKGRDRTKDVPILFLTAISREEERRLEGYQSGGVDYLFKPISPDLLRAKVSVFVQLHLKQRELERKTVELEQSNRDLEQFSYVASHDLQEPLRVVNGYLEMLEDHLSEALDEESRRWIDRSRATTARMAQLVAELLAYARAGAGPTDTVAVDLGRAIDAAREQLDVLIRESKAQIEVDAELPAVRAVEREVVQVLQNLIANAIKHAGDEPPAIAITAAPNDEGLIEVVVADTGRGIPPAEMERVFGLFERVEGSPYPGTGLGLAICRRIIEQRGGRIWMTPNDDDRGVQVHMTWPAPDSR